MIKSMNATALSSNHATIPYHKQRQGNGRVSESPSLPIDALDDGQLMARLPQEPTAATAALYDRYGHAVFSVALRVIGDREIAEEITQDVFVACWRGAHSFNAERGSLLTWLLTIAHRRAIDELRSRRGTSRRRETTWEQAPQHALATEHAIEHAVTQAEIRDALASLPTNQREAVELMFFGGFSRQEIADNLRTPLGTINTRLRLAMDKLRAAILPAYADT